MKAFTQGAFFRITVSEDETLNFAKSWPCTDFRHGDRVSFLFETRTGDLVDYKITHSHAGAIERNGEDVAALAEDAKAYGLKRLASKLAQ
jgi:hypothetical protein